ncbi:MAG: AMP-binding protein [Nitrososphaerota archaeon]|nr:AMP-binding protein [Nitrososphaerota archaeon]
MSLSGHTKSIREIWVETIDKFANIYAREPGSEKYWDPRVETAPLAELRRIQEEKLKVLIRYAYETSPFYHRKMRECGVRPDDVKGVEDLNKLPIVYKQDWMLDQQENPPFGSIHSITFEEWSKAGWLLYTTSGTTARPRAFMQTYHDMEAFSYIDARCLWGMGVRPGRDVVINCFGYGPFSGFWTYHYGVQYKMRIPVIPTGGMSSERRVFFIKEYRPTVLNCTASYALYLAEVAKREGADPAESSIRLTTHAGEIGAGVISTKKRIEESWGALCGDYAGATESFSWPLFWDCEEEIVRSSEENRTPYEHMSVDFYVPEILDPETLEPVGPGERGILVATNLMCEAYPVVRYALGDFVILGDPDFSCECGRTLPVSVGGMLGRSDDMIKVRGILIHPAAIEDVIRSFRDVGNEYQVVVTRSEKGLDELIVIVEARENIGESAWNEIRERLSIEIEKALGLRAIVSVKPPSTLPRSEFKARRIKDERAVQGKDT